jgi:hypothetical protein
MLLCMRLRIVIVVVVVAQVCLIENGFLEGHDVLFVILVQKRLFSVALAAPFGNHFLDVDILVGAKRLRALEKLSSYTLQYGSTKPRVD